MLRLSALFCWRELRSGQLWVVLFAFALAVACASSVGLVSDRLQAALGRQSAVLLGGDLVLRSAQPIAAELIEAPELRRAETLEFASVVIAGTAEPKMQLAAVKAVSGAYPLRGELQVSERLNGESYPQGQGPAVGEVWLEPRLFALLGIAPGDTLELGRIELVATRVLRLEPDRSAGWYGLMPRLLIHRDDVDRAGLLGPGSRVTWRYLYAGSPEAIGRWRSEIEPKLSPSERLQTPRTGRPGLNQALARVEQYLGLGSLLAIVLSGIAVALGVGHFSERHLDSCALMRCLGLPRRRVLLLQLAQLGWIALIGVLVGWALAFVLQAVMLELMSGWIRGPLPVTPGWAYLSGALTGILVLLGFGLPPLLRLGRVSPLRVLRRDLAPLPLAGWLTYLLALSVLTLLLLRYSGSLPMTLIWLAVALLLLLVNFCLGRWLLAPLLRSLQRLDLGLALRLALQRWQRQPLLLQGQLFAFTLTFMAILCVLVLRTDLLSRWQAQLPERTPNWFVLNIQPAEVDGVAKKLQGAGIEVPELYPLVRGRLTQINGKPAQSAVPASGQGDNALRRELNLTVSAELPEGNELTAGHWWPQMTPLPEDVLPVSLEAGLAERLALEVGDALEFSIAGEPLRAQVVNLRQLRWESMRPNFYMIFPPGSLERYPASWITSFYLSPAERDRLLPLMRSYPGLSLLDLAATLEQVERLLGRLGQVVELMLWLILLAGLAVLWAAVVASGRDRLQELCVLRILGARRRQLLLSQWLEFCLLGLASGLLALIGGELLLWLLYSRVFELDYRGTFWLWALPLLSGLLLGAVGRLSHSRVLERSPLSQLQNL